jgi:hypothetical protein
LYISLISLPEIFQIEIISRTDTYLKAYLVLLLLNSKFG